MSYLNRIKVPTCPMCGTPKALANRYGGLVPVPTCLCLQPPVQLTRAAEAGKE